MSVPAFFRVSALRFVVIMVAYTLTRALFLIWNWPTFHTDSWGELSLAFLVGLRFDTSAVLFTNAILFGLWMLPSRWLASRLFYFFEMVLFALVNFLCLGINVVDAEFVNFMGKRTSFDLLFIADDVGRHSTSVIATYWYFPVSLIITTAVMIWFLPRFQKSDPVEGWVSGALWRLFSIGLIVTGMRGGYQFKPISPMHAYFSSKHELGLLALNTPFNLIKTQPNSGAERVRYFQNDRDVIRLLEPMSKPSRPPLGLLKGWNVVVLIIESFGSEYTGIANDYPGFTPFFDELAKKSYYYKSNFANARRSIEGVPAVICGIPSMMEEPILTSDFSGDRFECLPRILREQGYSTYFLHGTHNGSMHFDTFSQLAGFENFVGLNEYPKNNPEDLDEYWGVLDEPMLQYAADVIDKAPKPVMLGLFTLSSHHPYYIPPKYRGQFPKGTLEIHESIGYTDLSLRKFFATAQNKPWFNHTIFILTADHTQKSDPNHPEYRTFVGNYRVPLAVYIPGLQPEKLPYRADRITQHIDILPTVLDLLGIEQKNRLLLGQSIFDTGLDGRAFNYTSYSYWYMDPHVAVDMGRPPHPLLTYEHTNTLDRHEKPSDEPQFQPAVQTLKAIVQYMNEGLVKNSLYKWKETLDPKK